MSSLKESYIELRTKLHSDGKLNRQVESQLSKINSDVFLQMMSSDEGYCFSFFIRSKLFKELMLSINMTKDKLTEMFRHEWGNAPLTNHMHSDIYYQFYLFLLYYYIKEKNVKFANYCLTNILIKLWNGRKKKYIPYCDKDIMAYVVNYMTSKKHMVNKHNDPLDLIYNYFTPTLLKKYQPLIEQKDSLGLKTIFEAAFTRIRQIFVFNPIVDIKTGASSSTGGLRSMFMKAKEDGLSIKTINVSKFANDESPVGFADYISINNLDEIIDKTVSKITTNIRPNYSDMFVNNLYKDYGIKKPTILHILKSIHDYKYKNQLNDIYSIILHQTKTSSKDDICSSQFTNSVDRLLKSKNNVHVNKLKTYVYDILTDIMDGYLKVKPLSDHSNNHLIQLHKLFIRGLIYNLRLTICV